MALKNFLVVALGGAVGAFCRYSCGILMAYYFGTQFPYGTLFVNVVGSTIIGALATYFAFFHGATSPMGLFCLVGFLGAFTTFSSFSLETLNLIMKDRLGLALINISANMSLCLIGTFLGFKIVNFLLEKTT